MNELLSTIQIAKWKIIKNDEVFNLFTEIENQLGILYAIIESTPEAKKKYQTMLAIRKMKEE